MLGRFCTGYQSRRFFTSLFQLLPIIGFVAPPLFEIARSTTVVTVSSYSHARKYMRNRSGSVQAAHGVTINMFYFLVRNSKL